MALFGRKPKENPALDWHESCAHDLKGKFEFWRQLKKSRKIPPSGNVVRVYKKFVKFYESY
jgi:hypothetical protein